MYINDPHSEQYRPTQARLTIAVIEHKAETYDEYHERKKREEENGKPKKVPFGFARVLVEDE